MQSKFLFGNIRGIPDGEEDTKENVDYVHALAITRKHDVFQHRDMAHLIMMSPTKGGFVKKLRNQGEEYFHGESISVGVRTDDSMHQVYWPLLAEGNWFKHTHWVNEKSPFTIFLVLERGYRPTSLMTEIEWEPIQYEQVNAFMIQEMQSLFA
jgi:hypothetical protein